MHKVDRGSKSLVDAAETSLIEYFRRAGLKPGDSIPKELELMEKLGVGRSVVREALSRFRMLGIVESKTKRGMTLLRPSIYAGMERIVKLQLFSDRELIDILGVRTALEIGIGNCVVRNISDRDIDKLQRIVDNGLEQRKERGTPSSSEDVEFHSELYRISGNIAVLDFMVMLSPLMDFVKGSYSTMFSEHSKKRREEGRERSHQDIINILKERDAISYMTAISHHFSHYTDSMDDL